MTNIEAIRRIKDHMMVHALNEERAIKITEALEMAINALGSIEQIRWERDVAMKQLEELRIEFGEETDGFYLDKEEYKKLFEYRLMYEDLCK